MEEFYALPVAGDSFLLRRDSKNILVDGGSSSGVLLRALSSSEVGINHLHIVVCTHADSDHAGGVVDFLDKSPQLKIDELWLPGAWSDLLPELLRNPQDVVCALVDEFRDDKLMESIGRDQGNIEEFEHSVQAQISELRKQFPIDRTRPKLGKSLEHEARDAGLAWLKEQAAGIRLDYENDSSVAKIFANARQRIRYSAAKFELNCQLSAFWINLINTGERIRKIAVQAIRHNVRVRWFDFGEFAESRKPLGGQPGLLEPLNAVELLMPSHQFLGMSYCARLSQVNEESLVFMSPAQSEWRFGLGVVFTSDSPLGDGLGYSHTWLSISKKPKPIVIATAPHHGAENNAMAYSHLNNVARVALWVRSGGKSYHPGTTYRKLPADMRACTFCPRNKSKPELVKVQLSSVFPLIRVSSRGCNCKV